MTSNETTNPKSQAKLPPRWVIRAAWVVHRAIYSLTGGRFGLRPASEKAWGMMRLRTIGRAADRSGSPSWATTRTARTWSPWP